MTEWRPYFIALAVGLLVGIERESSKSDPRALGVRTFLLISFLGAIVGSFQNLALVILICSFALGLIVISYVLQIFIKSSPANLGLTTEFAAGIVFAAGIAAHTSPILSATIGPMVALILFSKPSLHRFTHEIKPIELKAAITILLIAAAVMDLVPNTNIDPWGFFNPRKFGYLILILASLEFSSYVLLKINGVKKGFLMVGFLGGLVSSTAVLFSATRQAIKTPASWRSHLGSILVAQIASFLELLVILLLTSMELFLRVVPAIGASLIFCSLCLVFVWNKEGTQSSKLFLKSPLDWKGVFRLSFIFGILLALVSAAQHWIGREAIFTLAFLAGLFELQGISLASATLFSQNQTTLVIASQSILLAGIASLVAKVVLSWFFGRNRLSALLTLVLAPMICLLYWVGWGR